jgi:hypothetical protein
MNEFIPQTPDTNPEVNVSVKRLDDNLTFVKSKLATCLLTLDVDIALAQRELIAAGEVLIRNQQLIKGLLIHGCLEVATAFDAANRAAIRQRSELFQEIDRRLHLIMLSTLDPARTH